MLQRALLLNGTVGVGKSTVAESVAHLLAQSGEPHAWLDLDALSGCWPRSNEDPFNTRLTAESLACVSANFASAGARSLVLAGVIKSRGDRDLYERAVGLALTVIRLTAPPNEIEARLRRRYGDDDPTALRWHLDRAPALDAILDSSPVHMTVVPCTSSAQAVARAVLDAAGWAPTSSTP